MVLRGDCQICGKPFKRDYNPGHVPKNNFCSNPCRKDWLQQTKISRECAVCGVGVLVSPSYSKRHRTVTCSNACLCKHRSGSNNSNWRGGTANGRRKELRSGKTRKWRKAVYARDGHACVLCGSDEKLEVDHIKPWSLYPESRYDVDNGRVLCNSCHKKRLKDLFVERKKLEAQGYVRVVVPRQPRILVCPRCFTHFDNISGQNTYCSSNCASAAKMKRLTAVRRSKGICRTCPNPVKVNHVRCETCLKKAVDRARKQRAIKAQNNPLADIRCASCDVDFKPRGRYITRYCSKSCYKKGQDTLRKRKINE